MNRPLLDTFSASLNKYHLKGRAPWAIDHLNRNVYKAKRFIFDEEASFRLGQLMTAHPDLIAREMMSIKMPFDEMYIEVNAEELFKGRGGVLDPTADMRIAYTVENKKVVTLVEGLNQNQSAIEIYLAPFSFTLEQEQTIPLGDIYKINDDRDFIEKLKMAWVVGAQRDKKDDRPGNLRIMVPNFGDVLAEDLAKTIDINSIMPLTPKQAYEYSFMGGGDPMIFATAVMMINEQSRHTIIMDHAAKRVMHKGKSVALPEHSVVSVHIDNSSRTDIRYLISSNPGTPRREHDVRGHWVHYGEDPNCSHDWHPLSIGNTRQYICPQCTGRKTWRAEHVRGDIKLGRVDKVYSIKK